MWDAVALTGLVTGSSVLLGALLGVSLRLGHRSIARVMSFGAGVLIGVLAFELLDKARQASGLAVVVPAFLGGALVISIANLWLARRGAKHRKRCGGCVAQPREATNPGSGSAIALGTLIDGIPEAIVLGLSAIGGISWATVAGLFLSNLPEALSSAVGMRGAGRSLGYILGVWGGTALVFTVFPLASYLLLRGSPPEVIAVSLALTAGGALATAAETMLPEAFDGAPAFVGLITALGLISFFALVH